jgi:hypothetical protein
MALGAFIAGLLLAETEYRKGDREDAGAGRDGKAMMSSLVTRRDQTCCNGSASTPPWLSS